jgi:hypothetical protein
MLVDSDVLIWYLRGDERAAQFLDGLPNLSLSAVTYMELVQGMRNRQELRDLQSDLKSRNAVILPISERISERAVLLVEAHFHSHALQLADALIGATALELAFPLATANIKHYKVIEGLKLEAFAPH